MKTNTKKLLSILLALMMMLSVVPMYASAAPIALTEANVVEWPTVEYKNADGKYYYEQPIEDGLALTGGVVTVDGTATGTVVEGKFEFNYEGRNLPTSGTRKAYIKFVPTDTDNYSGFSVDNTANVTFVVTKTTPVFADEKNDPVVATEVEAGATLADSTLSGGKVVNPYNPDAPKLAASSWAWVSKKTVVNESGYYEARRVCGSYEIIYAQVYVRIIGDTSVTVEIEELPTVEAITYKEGLTAGDLVITGGKASVAGSFKVKDATQALAGGRNTVSVVFVPEDTTLDEIEVSLTVTVEKIPTYFIDENGNEIVPEIRLAYNSEYSYSSVKAYIETLTANCGEFSLTSASVPASFDTSIIGEYEYVARIQPKSSNYASAELSFKLIVEPKEITPTFKMYGNDELEIRVSDYTINPKGTFDFYVNDELVVEDIGYGKRFTWRPANSGTYDLKAVYNPIENDTYKVNDVIREDYEKILTWKINCINCGAYDYRYGETAAVMHSLGDQFGGWVFYDAEGNEFTPENVVEESSSVSFTMPDFSLTVEAKEKGALGGDDTTGGDSTGGIDNIFGNLGDLTEGDSDNVIVNIFNNIIAFFKNIITTITNIFRSIGDAS